MPRTPQQNQHLRDAARAKLLDSAMIVFAEEGYANASIRKIAAQAGVSLGLLYHYFDHKEALLAAVFENCMLILSTEFAGAANAEGTLGKVAFLIRKTFDLLQADPKFWGLFYGLRAQPAVMNVIGDSVRLWTGRLRDIFESCFTQAGRANPEIEARLLYSIIEGTVQQYLLEPENYPLEEVVARIILQFGTDD
ncbi:MAG: TetR/AcrR family transcriptional regulator [Anaerolineales bacterium]